ncbi:hypothetical protein BJY00DRAFT_306519 [Aspergillus carlsbadensis]|nr:hypothetical protein BJY00DRAFT_306519 [Aspergillus carlsbadensis]
MTLNIYVFLAAALAALTSAQATLDKPALTPNLVYLNSGNFANLPFPRGQRWSRWQAGLMPADCKSIAESRGLNPTDFEVWDLFYSDCQDPWSVCRHRNSTNSLETLIDTFSRVPVGMCSWVRHILTTPGDGAAYNYNGNVVFTGGSTRSLAVALHEAAHSLDLLGAYVDGALSSSQEWVSAYNADTHVADEYSRTNHIENIAQTTLVAIYDRVVPGGFSGVQPYYNNIQNQYTLIQDLGGDQIIPGGWCDRHLENSATVSMTGTESPSKRSSKKARGVAHDSSFKGTYGHIVKDFEPFSTEDFHH